MSDLQQEISDREAAEDYRHQRQEAEARKSGFVPMRDDEVERWLHENQRLIRDIARVNGVPEGDVDDVVLKYRQALRTAPPGSPFDDVNARVILGRILGDIESFCTENEIPIRGGIVAGVEPAYGTNIHQANVPTTDVSIIAATIPFIAFCNLVARAMARSLPHRVVPDALPDVSFDPEEVRPYLVSRPSVLYEWSQLLAHYAIFGWPPQHDLLATPQGWQQVTRIRLLRALELFAVAHEFGHHIEGHGVLVSSENRTDMLAEEHEADVFARIVSIGIGAADQPPNHFAIAGVGGVVILGALDLVRRAKALLKPGDEESDASHAATHPSFVDRVAAIAEVDQKLPGDWQTAAPIMRQCFADVLEIVWELTEPEITRLRDAGKRPHAVSETGADWLPV
ncbi:hypothetical protein [Chelativorans sp.]|uniref:hypothetical protein n=1 Tax=Chelativorans sp. TaxID=2203393 RepID=UPI0028117264|nr:hypothetical protein [Chelativorans sp.]